MTIDSLWSFCVAELLLCVLIVCADVSRNYVISQVAGLKPFSTKRLNRASRAVGTHYGPTRIHRAAAMHAGPTTATAPLRRWTGRRTTLDTHIWRSRPRAPGAPEVMTPTCAAGDRTRSAEVYHTAGLNNAGCATRLRRQAKEERRGPDPSWSRWKAETTAARSVTGRD